MRAQGSSSPATCPTSLPLRLGAGGTRFKALEALALGSPLVATAIGYEGIDVTDNENVLMAEDAGTFADRCVSILKSPDLRFTLSRNGRRLVEERYNWASLGQRLVERITSIYDARRRPHFPERVVNLSASP
jgi:glycosyltransferase involved in cell wall biosynthesis